MNKKVAKLAKVFHDDFNDNLQDIFDGTMKLMMSEREYFALITPKDSIEMVYYIYSLNKTGGLELGEKILSEVHLAQFFDYSKNNPHMEQCEDCDGDGNVDCSYCDGNGTVRCGECDNGRVECDKCGGDGESECGECSGEGTIDGEECGECSGSGIVRCNECDGEGDFSCDYCGGDGYESCPDCGGSGSDTCQTCIGDGEVEGDEFDYEITEWLLFDSELVNYLKRESEEYSPLGKTLEFAKRPTALLINSRKEHGEFDEEVLENNYYCFKITPLVSETLYFDSSSKSKNPLKTLHTINGVTTWDEPDTLLRG